MVGIFELESNKEIAKTVFKEKTLKIFEEAKEYLVLMNYAYKKKMYRETIRIAYESSMLVAEAVASYKGFAIRKRDCHLQSANIMKEYKDEFNINSKDISVMEEIRQMRNFFVHPENHYERIEKNSAYLEQARIGKESAIAIYNSVADVFAKNYFIPLSF
jgi:hypothetical protein